LCGKIGPLFFGKDIPCLPLRSRKFVVVAYGSKFDYVWQLTIRWQDADGEEYITTVNNEHGQPFSTAVQSSKTAYVSVPIGDGKATREKITRHHGG
jgi:hypothetical protein